MHSISKILGAATFIFLVVAVSYLFYQFGSSKQPPAPLQEVDPDFFPKSEDLTVDTDVTITPRGDALEGTPQTGNPLISQGGTEPLQSYQLGYLREIILSSQQVPSPLAGQRWYFVARTPLHTTHIVVIPDGSAYVDVVLTQAPYTISRMHAEVEFAHLFNGERVDLCGFPFYIHVESDPALKERGNLGLEYCGANKLEDTE